MKTKKWFGGAVVLTAALSLAMAGGAWAQSQERGSGSGSGKYGSEQGYQKGKKQTPPSKSAGEGALGVCTPESCGPKTPKPATGRPSQPETTK